jgi:hypothetical protein
VTESDSLAYPFPIAQHLAKEGTWRFWPNLAQSVYPLSQELLGACMILLGSERLGLVSAAELVVAALLILALARRVSILSASGPVAAIVAFGCPAVAFLAGSAKEDLLLVMHTAAAALVLTFPPATGAVATAGLFAGLAAGAKYTGLPIALAVVGCVPFCCGRHQRLRSFLLAGLAAFGAGGLWYVVNLVRFGNPVVPLMPGVGHFPVSGETAAEWLSGFGHGRGPIDFVAAPFRMTVDVLTFRAGEFGGRGNWINPLAWIGVPWVLANRRQWRSGLPLLAIGAALYVVWFAGMQVARLLLPALVVLSVPAADALIHLTSRIRILKAVLAMGLVISAGVVIVIGGIRFSRYIGDPSGFLERETEHYTAIQWINENLDPATDRVATGLRSSGYLRIPWMNVSFGQQVEISATELESPSLLRRALERQGFTHVFGGPEDVEGMEPWLVAVYTNEASQLGGAHFFRPPPTMVVSVFALKASSSPVESFEPRR